MNALGVVVADTTPSRASSANRPAWLWRLAADRLQSVSLRWCHREVVRLIAGTGSDRMKSRRRYQRSGWLVRKKPPEWR